MHVSSLEMANVHSAYLPVDVCHTAYKYSRRVCASNVRNVDANYLISDYMSTSGWPREADRSQVLVKITRRRKKQFRDMHDNKK